MIESVGIVAKAGRDDCPALLERLLARLAGRNVRVSLDRVASRYVDREGGFDRQELPEEFDLMIVLGGDGTLLSVARGIGSINVPILAVNLGGLGFMMTTGPDELDDHLDRVLAGDFHTQHRTLLRVEIVRDGELIGSYRALNDVVVNKAAVARLLLLDAYVDDEFVCSYRADGLIVSTPTGSTAYSLAAGGPVIFPLVSAICITPICPHTLTNRPVVLPETSLVEVVVQRGDDDSYLTVDGQVGLYLHLHDRIRVRNADHQVQIVQPRKPAFFDVLRHKMKWGQH
jgi:NAD+ kinase